MKTPTLTKVYGVSDDAIVIERYEGATEDKERLKERIEVPIEADWDEYTIRSIVEKAIPFLDSEEEVDFTLIAQLDKNLETGFASWRFGVEPNIDKQMDAVIVITSEDAEYMRATPVVLLTGDFTPDLL